MILNIDYDMLWFYELIDLVLIILDLNLAEVVLLPNLLELNWRNNKLEGSIPSDFKLFGALYSLDLSGNLLNRHWYHLIPGRLIVDFVPDVHVG
ncbi:hypothetical protein HN873_013290, partial [Arachis hypogaea]